MPLRGWALCWLLSSMWLAPTLANARAPILPGLSWVRLAGAESCISSIALAQRIEDRIGRAVFVPTSAAELTIEGFVAPRAGGGFVTQLSVVAMDGRVLGTRQLETTEPACSGLEEALILVIAVTLYPDHGIAGVSMLSPEAQAALDQWLGGEVENGDASAASQPAPATVKVPGSGEKSANRDTEMPLAPARLDSPERGLRLDAAVIGGGGMLPSPAFGLELDLALLPESFVPIVFTLQGYLSAWLPEAGIESQSVSFTSLRAGMLVCPGQRSGVLSVEGCIGFDAGFLHAAASGFVANDFALRPVLDALLQTNLRIRIARGVGLRLGISIGVPVTRATIETHNGATRERFTVSPMTLALHIGAGFML